MERDESWLRHTLTTIETPARDVEAELGAIRAGVRRRRRVQWATSAVVALIVGSAGAASLLAVSEDRSTYAPATANSENVCMGFDDGALDDARARDLQVAPGTVTQGATVTIRLRAGGQISPDLVTVRSEPPTCTAYRLLDDGSLGEFGPGGLSVGISEFTTAVTFDMPSDAAPGVYLICSAAEDDLTKEVCGPVTLEK